MPSALSLGARRTRSAHDEILQQKAGYLNVPFFLGRAVLYFAIWIAVHVLLNKWSPRRIAAKPASTRRDTRQARVVAAPGCWSTR